MKVSVVGSRRRNSSKDKQLVFEVVERLKKKYQEELILVSGGCPEGADFFMELAAKKFSIPTQIYYPKCLICNERIQSRTSHPCNRQKEKWQFVKEYFARNKEVAINSEIMIALVAEDRKGGTEDTISHMEKLKKKVILL